MKKILHTFLLSSLIICPTSLFAAVKLVSSDTIQGLSKSLEQVKQDFKVSDAADQVASVNIVAFPKQIPAETNNKLFATVTKLANGNEYQITLSTNAQCTGEKLCTAGSLTLTNRGNPIIKYDINNKRMTEKVNLANGISGYYTKGFALADYSPASIQWRDGFVLYQLSFAATEDKSAYIQMANSVISQISHVKPMLNLNNKEK